MDEPNELRESPSASRVEPDRVDDLRKALGILTEACLSLAHSTQQLVDIVAISVPNDKEE